MVDMGNNAKISFPVLSSLYTYMQPFFLCLPTNFLYYNIKEIAAQFLTEERYNVLMTVKTLILKLLWSYYNTTI